MLHNSYARITDTGTKGLEFPQSQPNWLPFVSGFWHFIAGGIFWGAYAPKGMNPWIYSIVMNGISALASGAAAIAVLLLLYAVAPSIYRMSLHRTSKV